MMTFKKGEQVILATVFGDRVVTFVRDVDDKRVVIEEEVPPNSILGIMAKLKASQKTERVVPRAFIRSAPN